MLEDITFLEKSKPNKKSTEVMLLHDKSEEFPDRFFLYRSEGLRMKLITNVCRKKCSCLLDQLREGCKDVYCPLQMTLEDLLLRPTIKGY